MNALARWLRVDDERWLGVTPRSLPTGAVVAVFAAVVIAFDRFGGASFQGFRAFTRLVLVGVWGWIGLGVGIALVGLIGSRLVPSRVGERQPSVQVAIAGAGLAHVPVLVFGGVIFFSAGALDILGPGGVTAVVVFLVWFPATLVAATRHTNDADVAASLVMTAPVYGVWWLLAGSHLLDQVRHLL